MEPGEGVRDDGSCSDRGGRTGGRPRRVERTAERTAERTLAVAASVAMALGALLLFAPRAEAQTQASPATSEQATRQAPAAGYGSQPRRPPAATERERSPEVQQQPDVQVLPPGAGARTAPQPHDTRPVGPTGERQQQWGRGATQAPTAGEAAAAARARGETPARVDAPPAPQRQAEGAGVLPDGTLGSRPDTPAAATRQQAGSGLPATAPAPAAPVARPRGETGDTGDTSDPQPTAAPQGSTPRDATGAPHGARDGARAGEGRDDAGPARR